MDLSDAGQRAVTRLAAALERTPPWPDAVLDDALAILVLSTAPLDDLDPIEEAILASFAGRVSKERVKDGAELARNIGAYFVAHPLPDSLAREMTAALSELSARGNAEKAAAALGAAVDAQSKVPVTQRLPAAGSQRMGVMGRFALDVKK